MAKKNSTGGWSSSICCGGSTVAKSLSNTNVSVYFGFTFEESDRGFPFLLFRKFQKNSSKKPGHK